MAPCFTHIVESSYNSLEQVPEADGISESCHKIDVSCKKMKKLCLNAPNIKLDRNDKGLVIPEKGPQPKVSHQRPDVANAPLTVLCSNKSHYVVGQQCQTA